MFLKKALFAALAMMFLSVDTSIAFAEWKQHACWCRTHHRKGHGLGCLYPPHNPIVSRRQITREAIATAQYNPAAGFALMLACQCQNGGARNIFLTYQSEVTDWLLQGGPCP